MSLRTDLVSVGQLAPWLAGLALWRIGAGRVIRLSVLSDTAKPMLSLCAAVAALVLGVSFDTGWRFDAGRAGIKLVLVPVVLCN